MPQPINHICAGHERCLDELFRSGYEVTRANGAVFLGAYVAYVTYLVFHETQNPALPALNTLLFSLLIPALVIGTVIVSVLALRREEQGSKKP